MSQAVIKHESFPAGAHAVPFADPFYETIALVKRRHSTLSPGTSELAQMATQALLSVPWGMEPTQ